MEATGFQCVQKIHNEMNAEIIANTFAEEVVKGGYKTIDTAGVKRLLGKKNVIIIDTMPAAWWAQRHIPGAINAEAGHNKDIRFSDYDDAQKSALIKQLPKKTYYWNGKKWTTKKPKTLKKCTKKKDENYGKKKYKGVDPSKTYVVYCGFVGCARSHEAAKFLVDEGCKKVYRYSGGIAAWLDANNTIQGSDIK